MTINIYRWDDASAPQLTGQVGSLTTLLDAILVNGYGSKAAAGWAIAFTGTNTRAYRPASGNRFYLAVDDTNPAPASIGANFARISSYETMTSAIVGGARIPTTGQMIVAGLAGNGALCMKSSSADSTPRPWMAYVSETFIHFFPYMNLTIANGTNNGLNSAPSGGIMWGDLVNSQKAGDAYGTILIAGFGQSASNSSQGGANANTTATLTAHYLQRAYFQTNSGIAMAKAAVCRGVSQGASIGSDAGAPNFPDPITGGIELSEVWVYEPVNGNTNYGARGRIPGLYNPLHNPFSIQAVFQIGDIVAGAGAYAGINYQWCVPGSSGNALMQITGTW